MYNSAIRVIHIRVIGLHINTNQLMVAPFMNCAPPQRQMTVNSLRTFATWWLCAVRPGIEPGTLRPWGQRFNHYTPSRLRYSCPWRVLYSMTRSVLTRSKRSVVEVNVERSVATIRTRQLTMDVAAEAGYFFPDGKHHDVILQTWTKMVQQCVFGSIDWMWDYGAQVYVVTYSRLPLARFFVDFWWVWVSGGRVLCKFFLWYVYIS